MFNKKRMIIFIVFIIFVFFMMTFASAPAETVKVNTRKVVFTDGYDSREIASYNVEVGKGVQVPQAPTHDGVIFAGWYDYYDNKVKINEFEEILNDTHVVALYGNDLNHNGILDDDEEHFLVSFVHGITKEVLKEEKVLIGLNATAPAEPTADGYTFTGWDKAYTNVQSDLTVNANFRSTRTTETNVRYYRVTFVDGENNEVITSYQVREGYSSSTPTAPTHEGKVFDHWNGTWTNVRSNQTVTAIYVDDLNEDGTADNEQGQKLTVKFLNEGELVKEEIVLKGMDATAPTGVTKASDDEFDYTFSGWDKSYTNVQTNLDVNAEYTSSKRKYILTINYVYEDGSEAATTYTNEVANGTNYSVDNPTANKTGYHTDSDKVTGVMPKGNETISVTYKPNTNNTYYVQHYTEKLDGEFELKETETKTDGVTGTTVTATAKEYTGFVLDESVSGTTKAGNINGVDVVTLKLYYKRSTHALTIVYKYQDEAVSTSRVVHNLKYQQPYEYETPAVDGYTADKPIVSGTFGDADVTVEVTYIPLDTITYKIYHYKQNIDGTYPEEPSEIEPKTNGVTNKMVTATAKEYEGFTYDENNTSNIKTGKVTADGNLVLKLYYTRNSHNLNITYKYSQGEHTANTATYPVKYDDTYSYTTPVVSGYTADTAVVAGIMKDNDIDVTVTYTASATMPYKVEHYKENNDGTYPEEPTEIENMTNGVTDQLVTAVAKIYEGYEVDLTAEGTNESEILTANNNVVLKLFYKRVDVNYTVKVFHDNEMKSETEYTGKYGDVINSSTYVSVPEGMKLNSNKTTEFITLGTSDVINIYYETTHVELLVSTNIETPRDPVEYGDQITYTFTIKNIGDGSGKVIVKDLELLKALNPTSGDALISIESSNVKINNEETIDYNALDILSNNGFVIDNMLPNQEFKVVLVVNIEANAGQTIISQVSTTIGETTTTQEQNIINVEKTVSLIRKTEAKVGANIIVVLDESGSMGYDIYGRRVNKFIGAKEATQSFIDKVFTTTSNSHGSTISVFTFGTKKCKNKHDKDCINGEYKYNNRSLGTATNYSTAQTLKYDISHSLPNYPYDSGTPYFLGLKDAYNALYGEDGNGGLSSQYPTNKNVVIFLSDGEPDHTDNATLRESYLTSLNEKGTVIYTIGYDVTSGSTAYNTLVHLAGSEGRTYLAGVSNLMSIFTEINTAIQDINSPIQTEEGVAEIGNVIYADNTHPIVFNINKGKANATTKSYVSIPAAKGSGYLTEDEDGYFHVDASKFNPGDTIEFVYFKSVS